MNVLILMPLATQRGGAEQTLIHLLKYGRKTSFTWHVVFFEKGPMVEWAKQWGYNTYVISAGRLRNFSDWISAIQRLSQLAEETTASLILSWMSKAHFYGGPIAKLRNIPSIWYQHGLPLSRRSIDQIITLIPACGIIATSKYSASYQQRLIPKRPVITVNPGVDLEKFQIQASQSSLRKRFNLPEDAFIVGMVGRLQRWKGFHLFVEAIAPILRRYPKVHGLLVGGTHDLEPDYPEFLEQIIHQTGLQKRIHRVGHQTNVAEWMQTMDIVVHASEQEPFGMVVIEAMALGKPVIASVPGGPAEVITPGENGLLWHHNQIDELTQHIEYCLNHPAFMTRLGTEAQKRAQDFSAEHYAQRIEQAIHQLLRENPC